MKPSLMYTLLLLFVSAIAHASPPQFISLAEGFDQFIAQSSNTDFETQLRNWTVNIESRLPEIYLHILAKGDTSKLDANRRDFAKKAFPFLLSNAKDIAEQFRIFESDGHAIINKLVDKYPDADMSNVVVIGIPSLNTFNGQVTTIGNKVYVMFGLDMIAQINANPDFIPGAILLNNLTVVMAHEFTHALHQVVSDFGSSNNSASLLDPLWEEGLAQVNSQMLVPGTSSTYVYMEKILADKCTFENISGWAKLYIADSKGSDAEIETAYPKWFLMRPEALTDLGVYRAGYCLGYNVILSALRQYSMEDILKMSRAQAYQVGQDALEEIAATAH